ncbi:TPA: type II toxin-antitoxin system RelB/DinJ family antitoxin [Serratia fonticola]|uniref:type II toxin-antitoxin system RelB/DinJ family antitoxin n=1 Tax=Serratia fonticola TaxID=47917 RepID=UPI00217B3BD1|nr:type II toxin-antitoxin system RelB/DinJ family antitoxin [Serratia fonticola]CAI1724523.1 Antitoxin DinJ [Serratia fonticola]
MRNSIVQARVDAESKERAEAVFKAMGMTISEAIRLFIGKVVKEGEVPDALFNSNHAQDNELCYQAYNDILSQLEYPEFQKNNSPYKLEKINGMLNGFSHR